MKKETSDFVIPFGMYAGKHVSEINVEYLDWLIGQDWMMDLHKDLEKQIIEHLKTRPEWLNM